MIRYSNQRQNQFLKDTCLLLTGPTPIVTTPGNLRQPQPLDWIVTQHLLWEAVDGSFVEVPRGDGWEADQALLTWPSELADKPQIYNDTMQPTQELWICPATSISGVLHSLYVALGQALSNTGVPYTVPDEYVPSIKWGIIADMLGKPGRAYDPTRAQYAEQRYQEGVQGAMILLGGWN